MGGLRAVDRLVVDVVVDNLSDSYSSKPANVSPEFTNVLRAGAKALSGTTLCCAQLGLSLFLTASVGAETRTMLFDAGPEGAVFLRNCQNLGLSLGDVECVAVSHGHWDHMGALLAALDGIQRSRGGGRVPCHVNPGMFLERAARLTTGEVAPFEPVPSPAELTAHGADVVNEPDARLLVDGHFYLSGDIPRVSSFEVGRPDHLARAAGGPWEADPLLMDERYLAAHVRGKGLVVFSACSHAGVVNVLTDVRRTFPGVAIHALFGGFHLSGTAMEARIPETTAGLRPFGLAQIVPAHCTGWRALQALVNAFGEPVVSPAAVGSRYTF
jgi:7,8-dihydropterin-6-yl-methyl-4-(beta-D-ribofuranosyl)aminobenzene 5'-phosphate synthase